MQLSVPLVAAPSLPLRVRARWRSARLTRELAAGTDPRSSAELALRAETLTRWHERHAIAVGIENVIAAAQEPPNPLSPRAPFERAAVREARADLEELARALRETDPPHPRGVALAERLLTGYDSPIYVADGHAAVATAARTAAAALS